MSLNSSQELLCQYIAETIKEYRRDELSVSIDSRHVKKWIQQFPPISREMLLSETLHILTNWYFNTTFIEDKFFSEIIRFLIKKYRFDSENNVFKNVVFLSLQQPGKSQDRLLKILEKKFRCIINNKSSLSSDVASPKHYVYVDDGLYTGMTFKKDILSVINLLPSDSTLDCFFLVAGSKGLTNNYEAIKPLAQKFNVKLTLNRLRGIENIPKARTALVNSTTTEEIYSTHQHCLWPINSIELDNEIAQYASVLKQKGKCYYLYRTTRWEADKGVFSSQNARNEVEKIFIKTGIMLLSGKIGSDCLYPLGFDCFPSWGFGSFLASDLNISNTCPLVLWSEASGWHPLFPRRTKYNVSKNKPVMVDFENWELTDNEEEVLNKNDDVLFLI